MLKKISLALMALCCMVFSSRAQNPLWDRLGITADSLADAGFIGHDADKHLYTAGNTSSFTGGMQMYVCRHDSLGNLNWYKLIKHNADTSMVVPTAMKVNQAGEVFIAGYSRDTSFLIKLDANGQQVWEVDEYYNSQRAKIYEICLTNSGDVAYIFTFRDVTGYGKARVKSVKQTTGAVNWSNVVSFVDTAVSTIGSTYYAYNHIASHNDEIFVSCRNDYPFLDSVIHIVGKYDINGNLLWSTPILGLPQNAVSVSFPQFRVGYDGQVYVATFPYLAGYGPYVVRIDNSGAIRYLKHLTQTAFPSRTFRADDMRPDSLGNIYLCGRTIGSISTGVTTIYKVDSNGDKVWDRYSSDTATINSYDQLAIKNNKTIYIVGNTDIPMYTGDTVIERMTLERVDSSGITAWTTYRSYAGASRVTYGRLIDIDNAQRIYVAGAGLGIPLPVAFLYHLYVARFADNFTGNTGVPVVGADDHVLIYPQPADNALHVYFGQPTPRQWQVVDMNGKVVCSGTVYLANLDLPVGEWAGGVYVFRYTDMASGVIASQVFSVVK